MVARLVRHPGHRESPRIPHGRIEIDPVGGIGKILALHNEGPQAPSYRRGGHHLRVVLPPREVLGLHDGQPSPTVLDEPTPDPGKAGFGRRRLRRLVTHDHVVVDVGDRSTPLAVGPKGHGAGGDGLEVGHQVTADEWMVEVGKQQEPRRLDGSGGDDHMAGGEEALGAVGADEIDPGGPASLDADPGDEGLGQQLGTTGAHGALQHGDGITLGVNGAAEEGAETTVVAGRPGVVGNAVDRGGCGVGVIAEPLSGGGRFGGTEHGRSRRHGERSRPGCGKRIGPVGPRHADGPLHLGVVRLELVVVERPVGHLGTGLGTELTEQPEVVGAESGYLAVGVHTATAHRRRDRVELPYMDVVAVGLLASEGAGLDQWVRTEEVSVVEFDLVIRIVERWLAEVVRIEQVVAALLDDDHRPAGGGEYVRCSGAPRP